MELSATGLTSVIFNFNFDRVLCLCLNFFNLMVLVGDRVLVFDVMYKMKHKARNKIQIFISFKLITQTGDFNKYDICFYTFNLTLYTLNRSHILIL